MENVRFKNEENGLMMAGLLFKPEGFDASEKYPAVVVTGPMISVKEQCQSIYAERLAKEGYVTIVFDGTYQGESEGEPRQLELPRLKRADIYSALDYLLSLDYVDKDRIAGLGMCGSGSYMMGAVTGDARFKVGASIVPAIARLDDQLPTTPEKAAEDKAAYESGSGEITYVDMMPREFEEGAAYYYTERGARPNWTSKVVSWSILEWVGYAPVDIVKDMKQPYLILTGEKAWSRPASEELHQSMTNEKKLHVVAGAGHFDMYDLEPYATENMEQISSWFDAHLS